MSGMNKDLIFGLSLLVTRKGSDTHTVDTGINVCMLPKRNDLFQCESQL